MHSADVIVLGAGIAGVSAACHLQKRGRNVVLLDRRDPGEETSHGNAGVIERDGFVPITFPKDPISLASYALNRSPAAHLHYRMFPRVAGWLMKLRSASSREAIEHFALAVDSLERHAVAEHLALAEAAQAQSYFRDNGWLHLYRSADSFGETAEDRDYAEQFGARYDVVDAADIGDLEPHIRPNFHKAIYWRDSQSVSSPGGVTKAYARLFADNGGAVLRGDARSLIRQGKTWSVESQGGRCQAPEVVAALGPWSMDVLSPLGFRFPFAVKRGYHRHYGSVGNASLSRPVVDMDFGYVITPMEAGIRLTTGIEFADRDAPPTPVQLRRLEPIARSLYPLADPVDDATWMGSRPCLPDSLPIVGPSGRGDGTWFSFGHGHIGFTTGPVTGRLLAEMMCGEETIADPAPFSPHRF